MNFLTNYHIEIIKAEMDRRLLSKPLYSLRSFAKDLGVTPAWLSNFLRNKRGLSVPSAKRIAAIMSMTPFEEDLFVTSVMANCSRSLETKKKATTKLKQLMKKNMAVKKVTEIEQKVVSNWYYLALMELVEVKGFDHSTKWISQKLGVPIKLIESAINDLVKMEWIRIEDGKIICIHSRTNSSVDIPSEFIKNYHEQLLSKAKQELWTQAIQDREFLNMTFAFDQNEIVEVKKYLRQMQADFADRFYTEGKPKNSVYQLSTQFFRLDKNHKEN